MNVEAKVTIKATKEAIWAVISHIENAAQRISGIEQIEILERPAAGIVGLKWKETRTVFGKTAAEVMWITDSAEHEFYQTRAESHGCVYISKMSIAAHGNSSTLTMTHATQPQSFVSKLVAIPMGFAFKGVFKKLLAKDLGDIKAAVEGTG